MNGERYDLNAQTCGCKRWDLTKIPCAHAICCLTLLEKESDDYVNPCYTKETYLKAYSGIIHPMNGQTMWEETKLLAIKPPAYYKRPGRAKKTEEERNFGDPAVRDKGPTKLTIFFSSFS